VYLHRKVLESDSVSANLHHWIDLVWGYKQTGPAAEAVKNTFDPNIYDTVWDRADVSDPIDLHLVNAILEHCGQAPPQLFPSPHPERKCRSAKDGIRQDFSLSCDGIEFASLSRTGPFEWVVRVCTLGGDFRDVFIASGRVREGVARHINVDAITAFEWIFADTVAIATSVGTIEVVDVASNTGRKCVGHPGRLNCLARDAHSLVSGGSDTFIGCWSFDFEAPRRTPSFRGEIVCAAASPEFHMVAAAASDGAVLLVTTETGVLGRVLALEGIPRKVLVTHEWGFVVVYMTHVSQGELEHMVLVYSVNGDFVRAKRIEEGIVAWVTWASEDGFDFLIIADECGRISICEVFYLDFGEPIEVCSQVVAIFQPKMDNVYVVVCRSGTVMLRPLQET
jgi:WD40 repeat protein